MLVALAIFLLKAAEALQSIGRSLRRETNDSENITEPSSTEYGAATP